MTESQVELETEVEIEPKTKTETPKQGAPIVEVRGLERIYRQADRDVYALAGVDLEIYKGEFTAS